MIPKESISPGKAGEEEPRGFKSNCLRLLSGGISYTLGVIRKRWYWLLAVIAITALLAFIHHPWLAADAFTVGIVCVFSFQPASFLAAGLIVTFITGIFLALRAQNLAYPAVLLAFILMTLGTLLGAWRLWLETGRRSDEGVDEG